MRNSTGPWRPDGRRVLPAVLAMAALCGALAWSAESSLDLAGVWRFQLDPEDAGLAQKWQQRQLAETLRLPGSLQEQGFGNEVSVETQWTGRIVDRVWFTSPQFERYREPGNVKVPFWLQPDKHYVGSAWYQREVEIPPQWQGRRLVLTLERAHWQTHVWLDGRDLGTQDSLSTPHRYDLGTGVTPGKHSLTIRVDNRMLVDVGVNAHSVSDHTQSNWNGLTGKLTLSATSPVWLDQVQVFPHVASQSALVKVQIGNATGREGQGILHWAHTEGQAEGDAPVQWNSQGGKAEITVPCGKAAQWDEFSPALQHLTVRLEGANADDQRTVIFGFRELGVAGTQFTINGRKTFLRGTLECCVFPRTGYPPTDVREWRRLLGVLKSYGLNHVRFHSWCPPEAAFQAADELGFYYQIECAAWAEVGSGGAQDQWLYDEAARLVGEYGNHPSFAFLAYGNEPHGKKRDAYLRRWVTHWKEHAPRQLHTSGSGWPLLPENQYHVTPRPRGTRGWGAADFRDFVGQQSVPVVSHEIGQWCVYPDFTEIAKYTGVLKAKNFEIFRDSLRQHGMLDQARDFLMASGKLQALCYKEEVEAALRTPGMAGFQMLQVNDFPGQGTALVGWVNPFWEPKGYLSPETFRRCCNSTVPLARLPKRVWTTAEELTAAVEVAHFGPRPLTDCQPHWKLVDRDGKPVAAGRLPTRSIPLGNGLSLGEIRLPLAAVPAPGQYRLVVRVAEFENDWEVWVYPPAVDIDAPQGVRLVTGLDDAVSEALNNGETVVLFAAPGNVSPANPKMSFTPVFWNRQWFPRQSTQTLGLLCDPAAPALAQFPTDDYTNWQWRELLTKARALVLDGLPTALRPIVQAIDDWNTNRRLGLVFECRVGKGKLLVCSLDLVRELDTRPAARQLRHSLLTYAASPQFAPTVPVELEPLTKLFRQPSTLAQLGATVQADSEDKANGNLAAHAVDGNPDTFWHTRWQPQNDPLPHHLTVDLRKSLTLTGFTYLPRQDMTNGRIAQYELYLSNDPQDWGKPVVTGTWPNTDQLQTLRFPHPVTGRYVKLQVRSEVGGNPFAAAAEVDVVVGK